MSKTENQVEYIEQQERIANNAQAVVKQLEMFGWDDAENHVIPLNEWTVFVHTGSMDEAEEERFVDRFGDEPYTEELEEDVEGGIWRWDI